MGSPFFFIFRGQPAGETQGGEAVPEHSGGMSVAEPEVATGCFDSPKIKNINLCNFQKKFVDKRKNHSIIRLNVLLVKRLT